jgi:MoxR-like ATPase
MSTANRVPSSGSMGASALKARLELIRDALSAGLIEREIPTRLALLAALAGEHVLLIGPPGTAKSELARRLRLSFTEQAYFERLLTRFSVPEELFGPLSIKALEEDRYQRQTDGYLPTAAVAFLDEIFKANSAILNALLTLLNEREFDNGTQRVKTPLVSVVGASNELPQEEELLALYDRFLVRCHVGPVSDDGFAGLLGLRGQAKPAIDAVLTLTPDDLERIHAAAIKVAVPAEVASLLTALRKHCQDRKIPVSDRRWRKALFLLQVSAHTDGREVVSVWDCWLLQHCLWHKPEELMGISEWYTARIGEATVQDPGQLVRHVAAWEEKLRSDREQGPQKKDARGRPLFIGSDGRHTDKTHGDVNGVRVANKPVIETLHYTPRHIKARTDGVEWVLEQIAAGQSALDAAAADVEQAVRSHIWLDPGFAATAQRRIDHQRESLALLDSRARASLAGFKALPRRAERLPPALADLPPSMVRALKTLGSFALAEQRRSGQSLEDTVTVRAGPVDHSFQVKVDVGIPVSVREAIALLNIRRPSNHFRDESDALKISVGLLREYLVTVEAPEAAFKSLDAVGALISNESQGAGGSASAQQIIEMLRSIQYDMNGVKRDYLVRRFEQHWSESMAVSSKHFFEWVALGHLSDEY